MYKFKSIRCLILLVSFSLLFVFAVSKISLAEGPEGYGQKYCEDPDFYCVTIGENVVEEEAGTLRVKKIRGSFLRLWPDKREREIVARINRMNKKPKKGAVLAVPNDMTDKTYMDYSPFPKKVEPECIPQSERVCRVMCENCEGEEGGEIKYKKVCEQPCIPVDKLGCGPDGQVFGEKMVIFDKKLNAFAAYDTHGNLVKWGPAYGGAGYCEGEKGPCRARTGNLLAVMKQGNKKNTDEEPALEYIRFFRGYGFGSFFLVPDKPATHRYIKVFSKDAKWLNKEFAKTGTRVIIKPEE